MRTSPRVLSWASPREGPVHLPRHGVAPGRVRMRMESPIAEARVVMLGLREAADLCRREQPALAARLEMAALA